MTEKEFIILNANTIICEKSKKNYFWILNKVTNRVCFLEL